MDHKEELDAQVARQNAIFSKMTDCLEGHLLTDVLDVISAQLIAIFYYKNRYDAIEGLKELNIFFNVVRERMIVAKLQSDNNNVR